MVRATLGGDRLNKQAANCTMIPGLNTKQRTTETIRRADGIHEYWQNQIAGVI